MNHLQRLDGLRLRLFSCASALVAAGFVATITSCHSTGDAADIGGLKPDVAAVSPDVGRPAPDIGTDLPDAGAADSGSADVASESADVASAGQDASGSADVAGGAQDSGDPLTCPGSYPDHTVGLIQCTQAAFQGYTLFAPIWSSTTYLIDMTGHVVHSWSANFLPGMSAYLLESGELLRTAHESTFGGAPTGGGVQRFAWDGTLVWNFTWLGPNFAAHHDVASLPNGNVLILYWEAKTEADVIAAGGTPNGGVWPDAVIEVQPTGLTTGNIVWEWHLWDHLLPANQAAADHPELVQLVYTRNDWLHTNSIAYHAEFDEIILSSRNLSELWIIDHSTTTAEAASHAGGNRGHGGDLLYRWGNPRNYGLVAEQMLYGQHDVHWIPPGLPGAGNVLLFNNGIGRGYSTVEELVTPVDHSGNYPAVPPGTPAGPAVPTWLYEGTPPSSFYSNHISGAQRLPNGDTLVCTGDTGTLFEITPSGRLVWEYKNPVGRTGIVPQGELTKGADVFRAYRYAPDYPGLAGKSLVPGNPIEGSKPNTPDAGDLAGDCKKSLDCRLCCASINLDGYNKLVAWMTPCVCGTAAAPGPCATECQDFFCAAVPPPEAPSQECTDCASAAVMSGSCTSVLGLCLGDTDCLAFQACRSQCPAGDAGN